MRRWELWKGDGGHAFFPEENREARSMAIRDGYRYAWACRAQAVNPAMRQLYDYLGWGEYGPMLREDGTPYPDDEGDEEVGVQTGPCSPAMKAL